LSSVPFIGLRQIWHRLDALVARAAVQFNHLAFVELLAQLSTEHLTTDDDAREHQNGDAAEKDCT
jgi:hypothetical protein